ncbi:hypothetical protein ACB092_07G023600 [Castanea dentata]
MHSVYEIIVLKFQFRILSASFKSKKYSQNMEEGDLIFEIHHGGRFKNLNGLIYVGGDISIHGEGYDRDCMSFIEVESILKSYGYKRGDLVYYKQVGMNLDEGLVQIKIDPNVLKMIDCHKGVESVVLYTVS